MEREEIQKRLKKELDKNRYEHTLGVMYTAGSLAMAYGYDYEKAMIAGLLHDCAKCLPTEKKISLCEKNDILISKVERENPGLLHAKAGMVLAEEAYGVKDPQFEGQTKAKLGTSEAKGAVESVLSEYLTYFLEENPNIGKTIIEKGMMASRARDAARKARELVRRKTGLENTRMPGKLTDCTSRDPYECEIYIVEGNSAGGSAIKARDPRTQAVLPLRGKILNVEKARLDRILNSEEIRNMITAFGTGISDDFDMSKLRYHKIVIMTDADVDGAHIRTLLLTFFYRYMPQLIEGGKVYVAQPPLYRVEKNKQHYYVYDDMQLEALYQEIGRTGIKDVQRYKGLGEMDFDQLRDTTMAVEHRILKLVTIDDAVLADQVFSMLMGDEVEPRKIFIEENAQYAEMDF